MFHRSFIAWIGLFLTWTGGGMLLVSFSEPAATAAPQAQSDPNAQEALNEDQALTDAERLLRLEKVVRLDREKLSTLEGEFETKSLFFDDLARSIRSIEAEIAEKKKKLGEIDRVAEPGTVADLEVELKGLEQRLEVTRRQSEITFQAAKTVQAQVEALKKKITREDQAIQQMIGTPVDSAMDAEPEPEPVQAAEEAPPQSGPPIQLVPGVPLQVPVAESGAKAPTRETADQIEARRQAEKLETQAEEAEQQVRDFLERKAALEEQIELEKQLLQTARDSRDNLNAAVTELQRELREQIASGGTKTKMESEQTNIDEVQDLATQARAEIDERRNYLDSLHQRLEDLHEEQLLLTREAETRRLEAEQARKKSGWLESPLHPQNVARWLKTRGPRMLLVVGVAAVLLFLIRFSMRPVARTVVRHSRGSRVAGTSRADTLALSFRGALTVLIIAAGALLVLQEAGVDVKTVLGGAAILGVAIAFGAQNMMRDYFSGFMILLEDQFELGDLITISGITGRVEKVNMRTTMLRDIEGRVHFIPNGEIKAITNRTYVWGRAVVEIPIAFEESVDHVMEVLLEIAREMRQDPDWGSSLTDEPVMLGVDKFTEYGVIIKFMIKTQPDKIFATRRELLRRVKNRFDELGIQISVPYRRILRNPGPED
jgi:small-conductance mechanosensitive channel